MTFALLPDCTGVQNRITGITIRPLFMGDSRADRAYYSYESADEKFILYATLHCDSQSRCKYLSLHLHVVAQHQRFKFAPEEWYVPGTLDFSEDATKKYLPRKYGDERWPTVFWDQTLPELCKGIAVVEKSINSSHLIRNGWQVFVQIVDKNTNSILVNRNVADEL